VAIFPFSGVSQASFLSPALQQEEQASFFAVVHEASPVMARARISFFMVWVSVGMDFTFAGPVLNGAQVTAMAAMLIVKAVIIKHPLPCLRSDRVSKRSLIPL
jgi:hypothetical protein